MATVRVSKTLTTPASTVPPVATVYRAPDGALHHTRCRRRMEFMGNRAGVELDFYCYTCCEHITLNYYMVTRLPEPAVVEITSARGR